MSVETALSSQQPLFYQVQGNEAQVFEYAHQQQLPVLLKGPTGCGKTRFVEYMAQKLNKPLYTVACHDDLTAADLVGRHLISHDGTYWQDGPLTRAVREGGICYLDEIVEARKDTTVVLHPLADDRRILPLERTGEILTAPPGFMLVVSYNPGYQNMLKGLKPSTRQRFVALSLTYPSTENEIAIVQHESGCSAHVAGQLVQFAQAIRQLEQHDLEEVVSTRLLIYAARMMVSQLPPLTAIKSCIAEPLSDDPQTVKAIVDLAQIYFGND
jgi:nitric oxide reductase NorQ protein